MVKATFFLESLHPAWFFFFFNEKGDFLHLRTFYKFLSKF